MFDNISFEIKGFREKDFNYLVSYWIKKEPKTGNGRYLIDWNNLRINYFTNQHLIKVSNLLHKFYNAEISGLGLINYDNYIYTKLEETVNLIQSAFNRSSRECKLLERFEYG